MKADKETCQKAKEGEGIAGVVDSAEEEGGEGIGGKQAFMEQLAREKARLSLARTRARSNSLRLAKVSVGLGVGRTTTAQQSAGADGGCGTGASGNGGSRSGTQEDSRGGSEAVVGEGRGAVDRPVTEDRGVAPVGGSGGGGGGGSEEPGEQVGEQVGGRMDTSDAGGTHPAVGGATSNSPRPPSGPSDDTGTCAAAVAAAAAASSSDARGVEGAVVAVPLLRNTGTRATQEDAEAVTGVSSRSHGNETRPAVVAATSETSTVDIVSMVPPPLPSVCDEAAGRTGSASADGQGPTPSASATDDADAPEPSSNDNSAAVSNALAFFAKLGTPAADGGADVNANVGVDAAEPSNGTDPSDMDLFGIHTSSGGGDGDSGTNDAGGGGGGGGGGWANNTSASTWATAVFGTAVKSAPKTPPAPPSRSKIVEARLRAFMAETRRKLDELGVLTSHAPVVSIPAGFSIPSAGVSGSMPTGGGSATTVGTLPSGVPHFLVKSGGVASAATASATAGTPGTHGGVNPSAVDGAAATGAGQGATDLPPALQQVADTTDANVADNWDDEDGYYRVQMGEVVHSRYKVTAKLGRGMFSTVIKAFDTATERKVAIKIVRRNDMMERAAAKEIRILTELAEHDPDNKHRCIRLLAHFTFRKHVCIVRRGICACHALFGWVPPVCYGVLSLPSEESDDIARGLDCQLT